MKLYLIKDNATYGNYYDYIGTPVGAATTRGTNDDKAFLELINEYVVDRKKPVNKIFFMSKEQALKTIKNNIRLYGKDYYKNPTVVEYIPDEVTLDAIAEPIYKELKKAEKKYLELKKMYDELKA